MNMKSEKNMTMSFTRNDIEEFLYREAALLDGWRLDEWFSLFTNDAIYHIPTVGTAPEVTPENTLFYIADDWIRLRERVVRLQKKSAHVEWPRSRTRHMVTNVLIDSSNEKSLTVSAAFAVHRFKNGHTDLYVGAYRYFFEIDAGQLKIKEKRVMLDMDALRPHGRVSIIL
jgi:p-cumate 2,3-dioxygenase beta subunit